jgi:xylose isomerase
MYILLEIIRAGGLTGGINFDAKNRRSSYTYEDMFKGFILAMDSFALGLIKAVAIIEDGRIDNFLAERYSSYNSGIGKKIADGTTDLVELFEYAENLKDAEMPGSGNQEGLEAIFNQILFKE